FELLGATPHAEVRLVIGVSGMGPGACPPALGGGCLYVRPRARLLNWVGMPDDAGYDDVSVHVPPHREGAYVTLQAVSMSDGALSNAVGRFVGPPGWTIDETGDIDGDGYSIADGDCADFRADVHPGLQDYVGDGVDWNCDDADGDDGDHDGAEDAASGGPDCDDADPDTQACSGDTTTASFVDTLGDDIGPMWPATALADVSSADDVVLDCEDCPTCTSYHWSLADIGYAPADIDSVALYLTSKEALIQDDIMQWSAGCVSCFGAPCYPRYNFLYWNTSGGLAHLDFTETAADCSMTMWNVMGPREVDGSEGNLCQSGVVGGTGSLPSKVGERFQVTIVGGL
ncbi:MAG TPA: hypothetical protein PKA64_25475, partial [Myxococcota bacterium]|nr:hypothetical protein [Myxococcota bacterium]